MNWFEVLMMLIFLHALGDFALQNNSMAQNKNRHNDEQHEMWFYYLLAHGMIQGGLIGLFLGNWFVALFEFVMHCIIDFLKCEERLSPHSDQVLHVVLRVLYCFVLVM